MKVITTNNLKITHLKPKPHLPRANEFRADDISHNDQRSHANWLHVDIIIVGSGTFMSNTTKYEQRMNCDNKTVGCAWLITVFLFLLHPWFCSVMTKGNTCRQTSNIGRTKSQKLNVYRLELQLSLPNPLKVLSREGTCRCALH